ncbi:3-phosphoshikimate 1-carboxyvinyltransferase [uncultured Intestinimonas sp.]|uniref:3-phosphoshikimate 1-carboxyvinyltransferase n=1 Tax=uncultured Intestinimonas sp. TaxID=1689265 RepID=UPI0025E32480|nr:3-phosphoshikimate 1-carboxyvinyltransferase [uncultured Intestinimonas sp.]
MDITITPGLLGGSITPPPSKSQAHRALIAAALAEGVSMLKNVALSQDIQATIRCLETLGASFRWEGDTLAVTGLAGKPAPQGELPLLDCGESGSTLRFLIPISLAVLGGGRFTGHGRLMERPQGPYFDLFREKGIFCEQKDSVLTVSGRLESGIFSLPGNVSSQFITGPLYTLPLLSGDSEILLITPLESRGYVDMTLDVLEKFGVRVENRDYASLRVPGNQAFQARDLTVEADWSNAAFWYAAALLESDVDIQGLDTHSTQGDAAIAGHYWTLARPADAQIDVSGCPDLVPPLAAMAALRGEGLTTRLVNAARLRMKESDRLSTVTEVLNALGADVEEHDDYLVIRGKDTLPGGVTVSGHNDHRIAMMAAIAATNCDAPVTITGAECVKKSYPNFWEDYEALGGVIARAQA